MINIIIFEFIFIIKPMSLDLNFNNCVLFPGFEPNLEMFCSFTIYYNSSFINFKSSDNSFILFSFLFNKFYVTSSASSSYGKFLYDYLKCNSDVKRKTTSINGKKVSLINNRYYPCLNIILDELDLQIKRTLNDDYNICSTDDFTNGLLKILIKANYDEMMTKKKLVDLYEKYLTKYIIN